MKAMQINEKQSLCSFERLLTHIQKLVFLQMMSHRNKAKGLFSRNVCGEISVLQYGVQTVLAEELTASHHEMVLKCCLTQAEI